MASRGAVPRTIREATRFTSNTPHASSRAAVPQPLTSRNTLSSSSSPSSPSSVAASAPPPPSKQTQQQPPPPSHRPSRTPASTVSTVRRSSRIPGETPEQRVARLRRQHDLARMAQESQADKIVSMGRRVADAAHRFTIYFIIVFTVCCVVFLVVVVADMIQFNRKRRREFEEAVSRFREDSLEAARLAFIRGTATEEQAARVQAANRQAEETGVPLPPLIDVPAGPTMGSAAVDAALGKTGAAHGPAQGQEQGAAPQSSATPDPEEKEKKAWWRVW